MTRPLVETASAPQQVVSGPQEAAFNPIPPEPIGFNGGSTEQGTAKATVKPVFELGELKVTSLPTTEGSFNGNVKAGTKSCKESCGGTCATSCVGCGTCGTCFSCSGCGQGCW